MTATDAFKHQKIPGARPKFKCYYQGRHFGYCFAASEEEAVVDCARRNPHHIASDFMATFHRWEVPHG